MASPIHSYLFSPPASPPSLPADHVLGSPALNSIRSLIPTELLPRSSLDGSVKANSPLAPRASRFTDYPAYPGVPSRLKEREVFTLTVEDTSLPPSQSCSPKVCETIILGSQIQHLNVPTSPTPVASGMPGLPRPLIRLLCLGAFVLASMLLVVCVPGVRLPSVRAASVSPRLALAEDGRAYIDVLDPIKGFEDAKDRDYLPPQIYAGRLDQQVKSARVAPFVRPLSPPPKTSRPVARPLPRSHELLALQSYLLQSTFNILPADLDTTAPLDSDLVLGYAPTDSALTELEAEHANDIVVWYGGSGSRSHPHELLTLLSEIHGSHRRPTLLPLTARPDFDKLLPILNRLDFPMEHGAVVMLGNRPFAADLEKMREMKESGRLANLMNAIGWAEGNKEVAKKGWKPNMAKVKRKEKTEVEHALEVAKAAKK